jgi:hypothetical protein
MEVYTFIFIEICYSSAIIIIYLIGVLKNERHIACTKIFKKKRHCIFHLCVKNEMNKRAIFSFCKSDLTKMLIQCCAKG